MRFPLAVISAGTRIVKCLCAGVCLLVCSGPILIIVGMVLLVSTNTRDSNVAEYNAAVKSFNTTGLDKWISGTIGGISVSEKDDEVAIEGDTEGVDLSGTSQYVMASVPLSSSPTAVPFNVATVKPFTRQLAKAVSETVNVHCNSQSVCSADTMVSLCNEQHSTRRCS